MKTKQQDLKTIRIYLTVFIVLLLLSGITAFPIRQEIAFLVTIKSYFPLFMQDWVEQLDTVLHQTPDVVLYGTDWLAFAHIVIAIAFIGPLKDPVRNSWVLQFGMIACVLILPLALICGPIRGIPLFHQVIDCSFGLTGLIPLGICYGKTKALERSFV